MSGGVVGGSPVLWFRPSGLFCPLCLCFSNWLTECSQTVRGTLLIFHLISSNNSVSCPSLSLCLIPPLLQSLLVFGEHVGHIGDRGGQPDFCLETNVLILIIDKSRLVQIMRQPLNSSAFCGFLYGEKPDVPILCLKHEHVPTMLLYKRRHELVPVFANRMQFTCTNLCFNTRVSVINVTVVLWIMHAAILLILPGISQQVTDIQASQRSMQSWVTLNLKVMQDQFISHVCIQRVTKGMTCYADDEAE